MGRSSSRAFRRAGAGGLTPGPSPFRRGETATAGAAGVTCHNYARYLGQCIESLLAQTVPFAEIIVIDDASDDGTGQVAARYRKAGVQCQRIEARNSCEGRNEGMRLTNSRLIANVDADNWLGPRWLETLLPAMDDLSVGIAHSPPMQVDEQGRVQRKAPYARPYDHWALRRANFIDTCSLVRREAVRQAGGWDRSVCKRLDDWYLWLRITGLGWGATVLEEPTWYYRVHGGQKSAADGRDTALDRYQIMRDAFHVAVVTPFCGRRFSLKQVLGNYRRLGWEPERLHGLFVDNSEDAAFGKALRAGLHRACADWGSVTIVRDGTRCRRGASNAEVANTAKLRNTDDMAQAMSRLYAGTIQRLLGERADVVLTIEDDIEVVGEDIIPRLLTWMESNVMAVSGTVLSRFEQTEGKPRAIAYDVDGEAPYRHHALTNRPEGSGRQQVGGTGVGCLLTRGEAWQRYMPRRVSVNDDGRHAWHDVAFAADVRRRSGLRWLLDWDVRTRHWQENGTWV